MLLQQLVRYANVQLVDDLPPPGFQLQPIRYVVDLTSDGSWRGILDTASKDAKRGELRLAPHAKRAMGIVPKLLADTSEYVLGIPRNDPAKAANPVRIAQQHRQFMALLTDCATQTAEPSVNAVHTFLSRTSPETFPQPDAFDPSANLTFRVDGVMPIDLSSVRHFWASTRAPDESDGARGKKTHCLICGRFGPILERHPLKIKGIPGGQIQKDLISANAGAFESYGLTASEVSPTCPTCAEAYGNALNSLLANKQSRLWAGGLAFAFWSEPGSDDPFEPVPLFTDPEANASEIRALMKAATTGRTEALSVDPTAFFSVALGASGARVVVKDWIDTTVAHAKRSIGRYFILQDTVEWNGVEGTPLSMSRLARSTLRVNAKLTETPPDIVYQSLMRLALRGTPLPMDLLYLAVRRNRADQNVSRGRAALIKMVLSYQPNQPTEEEQLMPALDFTRSDPAYVCGRLLATIDRVQRSALGNPNATVIDRFYGSASSAPASVFGNLLDGAQAHMNKLRKTRRGAYVNLDKQLQDVMDLIDDFPSTLTLKEQGLFALGFYHQRAADRAQANAHRASKGLAAAETDILPDTDETNV